MISLSILDYSPIDEGSDAHQALWETTELAKHAESLGFKRFWVSEHHMVHSVAGSSPEMLMMHLAGSTSYIRIGSGGVMLPHYSSYKAAENFRIMEALHPNRIDMGIGRSPSYRLVNQALNEGKTKRQSYEQQVEDLKKYFTDNTRDEHRFQPLVASPVIPTKPEMWMLGTGERGARAAASQGLGYVFAHFAKPGMSGVKIVEDYRKHFEPSPFLDKPKTIISLFAVVGETEEEAEDLAKAFDLWLYFVESENQPPYYPSIETAKERGFTADEEVKVKKNRSRMIIGTAATVSKEIKRIAEAFDTDEIMIIPNVSKIENRKKVIELLAEEFHLKTQ
ncbi:LLM class flavin-dependent oxidoreductase [Rossellomorea vietnamensis]|uniref:LLM class flavin-dependent oxidoreductase n=1 Tax=Rossellomorea vietnamensis TaxID=218284 RepID=A0A5D4K5V4_9BACI|nr:LLM class flavin-dependent oxidoreductase [Rossellomorea vietnamensis]TYR72791.1 LLM class flavin-dependent oxidoreductase [Rossellomorea vietnamensis]